MATEAARLESKESTEGKEKKEKNTLDSYRPSHGRHVASQGRWFAIVYQIFLDFSGFPQGLASLPSSPILTIRTMSARRR